MAENPLRLGRHKLSVADLLSMQSGSALVAGLAQLSEQLSATDAQQLARHLLALDPPTAT